MVTQNMEQYKGVFIYAQQVDGEISPIAFELLGKAKDLAADLDTNVTAVLLGSGVKGLADQLAEHGALLGVAELLTAAHGLVQVRLEPLCHAVEAARQLAHLVRGAHLEPGIQLALLHRAHGGVELAHRFEELPADEHGHQRAEQLSRVM